MASPAVLTTVDDSRLNKKALEKKTTQKKRKRPAQESHDSFKDVIIVKRNGQPENEVRLCPIVTVSRFQIPLAYLDTTTDGDNPLPPVFRGSVNALEDGGKRNKNLDAVLLAEQQGSTALFVIEKIRNGIFALCRLQQWVEVSSILGIGAKRRKVDKGKDKATEAKVEPWWTKAALDPCKTKPEDLKQSSEWLAVRKRLSMRPPLESIASPMKESDSQHSLDTEQSPVHVPRSIDSILEGPSAEDLLTAVKTHYLELLYISRMPLAYFAKGPLSRARAAVKSNDPPSLTQAELLDFLRSYIMTLNMGTKKYEAGLADLIKELPPGTSIDDDENQLTTPVKDKIRKSRKRKKMSKLGLVPGEEEYVVRWWAKREASLEYAGLEDTRESRIKSGLSEQRARETQLQMILILEVLALEATASKDETQTVPSVEQEDTAEQGKRVKRSRDLMSILDVLIDRLCIWESMNSDGPTSSKSLATGGENNMKGLGSSADNDNLRDFCTDVIVPYYASRLPELYVSISQKLGGPSNITSSTPATRTPAPKKSSRTQALKKGSNKNLVGSTQDKTSKRSGGLSRSATDSQLPPLKRELSGVDLSDIPRHRPTLRESGRYSQREVDLAAVTKGNGARNAQIRAQKKAAEEQELKKAIDNLRRPNARMAVKDYVEQADHHHAALNAKWQSRKPKNPVHNPFATTSSIQVAATPRVNRQGTREAYALPPLPSPPRATLAPALDSRIPSSTQKPRSTKAAAFDAIAHPGLAETPARLGLAETPLKSLTAHHQGPDIEATPSRKRAKLFPARRPTNPFPAVPEIRLGASGDAEAMFEEPELPAPRLDTAFTEKRAARTPLLKWSRAMPVSSLEPRQETDLPCTPSKSASRALLATPRQNITYMGGEGSVEAEGDQGVDANGLKSRGQAAMPLPASLGHTQPILCETPAKKQPVSLRPSPSNASGEEVVLLATPAKATPQAVLQEHEATEQIQGQVDEKEQAEEHEGDIYAALGWNDDYDL